jgi:RNase P protein component
LVREAFRLRQRELAGLDVLVRIRTQPDRAEAVKSRSDLAGMLAALIK